MRTMQLNITTLTPTLLASEPPAHNLQGTLGFIPGNTIRGVFARRYLSMNGAADQKFSDLFISGRVKFGCARINGSRVIPLSARSCKYDGGFSTQDEENHGVVDLLFHEKTEKRCPHCKGPLDYYEGFFNSSKRTEDKVETRIITRSAMYGTLGVASSGQLFSQRVIEENQVFIGTVEIADDLFDTFISLVPRSFTAAIGTGRSRGQGWVEIQAEDARELSEELAAERYSLISSCWKLSENDHPAPPLIVTLLSDALLHDDYLRDLTGPSLTHLQNAFDLNPEDWESEPSSTQTFSTVRQVHGFDGSPWMLPRAPRVAVAAGSVFAFRAKTASPKVPSGNGIGWIGDLNIEGYGSAILWDHFHIPNEKGAPW